MSNLLRRVRRSIDERRGRVSQLANNVRRQHQNSLSDYARSRLLMSYEGSLARVNNQGFTNFQHFDSFSVSGISTDSCIDAGGAIRGSDGSTGSFSIDMGPVWRSEPSEMTPFYGMAQEERERQRNIMSIDDVECSCGCGDKSKTEFDSCYGYYRADCQHCGKHSRATTYLKVKEAHGKCHSEEWIEL